VETTKTLPSIQKIFFHITLCRAFFAGHFGKKMFRISLRNDDVLVKVLNTVKWPEIQGNIDSHISKWLYSGEI